MVLFTYKALRDTAFVITVQLYKGMSEKIICFLAEVKD